MPLNHHLMKAIMRFAPLSAAALCFTAVSSCGQSRPGPSGSDGGATLAMLDTALTGIAMLRRRFFR
jgi:hypothetical protein